MRSHHRGVMLVETLLAVMLVSAAIVLASRLTVEIFHQQRDVPRREAAILRSQWTTAELRRLVWNASALSPIEDGVRVTHGGQTTDVPGRFRVDGPALIADFGDGDVRLISQVMLANGGRR